MLIFSPLSASILRRRKNQKPNENEEEDLQEALREAEAVRTQSMNFRNYASLQDLSAAGLQQLTHHNEGVPFSKHTSTNSLNNTSTGAKGSTTNGPKLKRQNSEPLGVQI